MKIHRMRTCLLNTSLIRSTVQQEIFVSEKFRQERPSGSSSGMYFRQTSVVAHLLAGCSLVTLLLTVIFTFMNVSDPTLLVCEKI